MQEYADDKAFLIILEILYKPHTAMKYYYYTVEQSI